MPMLITIQIDVLHSNSSDQSGQSSSLSHRQVESMQSPLEQEWAQSDTAMDTVKQNDMLSKYFKTIQTKCIIW